MFGSQYLSKRYLCPDCGGSEAYRSRRRNFLEKYVLPILLLQPARCANCFRRTNVSMLVSLRPREPRPPVNHHAAA